MSVRPQAKDKPSPVNFQWDDPFMLDEQLTEDERMIRDTARAYAQDKLLPRVTKAYLEEKVDRDIFHEMGELGLIGITLAGGIWLCQCELRGLWPGGARDRARRFRVSLDEFGAILARDASDLCLWRREPAQEISAQARNRRVGWLFRADRAGRRLRSRRNEDTGREDGRRLSADRHENVDFQRADRRRVRGLGKIGRNTTTRSGASSSRKA